MVRGYRWLLKEFPAEFCVIDANRDVAEVRESVIEKIEGSYKVESL